MKSVRAVPIAIAAVMLALEGCSPAPITRDRLISTFHSVASSAAETELFLDRLQKREATSVYARTYADSLADAIRQNRQELQRHPPAKGLESAFAECQREYELLLESVNDVKTALSDRDALAAVKIRVETIRKKAEQSLNAVELSGIKDESKRPIARGFRKQLICGVAQELSPACPSYVFCGGANPPQVGNLPHNAAL